MPLDHIGRYKIEAELGKGAMGLVYKATDPNIGRTVALKTMRVDIHGMESEEMLKRFQAEARNAGVLNHPNIVTIYDAQELEGTFYIAMEFIQGETLQQLLTQGTLPLEKVMEVTRQVCAGLDYAHARGIIHRDIKPANIMMEPDGTVKIMDFGIAKGAGTGMTSTGQVLGTPNYMSPEQVKGKPLDGRSDLFSMGVVLYEMLTGERPFTGENVTTIIYKIVNEQPPAPRDLDITVHPGLSAAVMKALAKNREERYQKCSELARDLENYKNFGSDTGQTTRILVDPAAEAIPIRPPAKAVSGAVSTSGGAAAAPKAAPMAQAPLPMKPSKIIPPAKVPTTKIAVGALAVVLAFAGYIGIKKWSDRPQPGAAAPAQTVTPPAQPATPALNQKSDASSPAEAAKNEPPAAAAAAATEAPTTGELRVASTPAGAKFTIDGRSDSRYVTPFNLPKVKPGPHTVVFTLDGYKPETRRPEVTAGKRAMLNAMLVATVGFISVGSNPPGASVLLDGKLTGEFTPTKLKVEPGQHKITIKKQGYRDETISAMVVAGQTLTMDFPLPGQGQPSMTSTTSAPPATSAAKVPASQNVPPSNAPASAKQPEQSSEAQGSPFRKLRRFFGGKDEHGTIVLRTTPMGAEIWVDGKQTAYRTPIKFPAPVGKYKVTLRLPGYKPLTREVSIEKGKTATIEEPLDKQ